MHVDKKLIVVALSAAVVGGLIGGVMCCLVGHHSDRHQRGMMGGKQRMMGEYRSGENGQRGGSFQTGQSELNTSTTTVR